MNNFKREWKRNKTLFLMLLPALFLIIITAYLPMGGLILAFKEYRYDLGILKSPWCGLDNFAYFFKSGTGWLVTKNTIIYNLANLITSQALSLMVAIIISEMSGKFFKKTIQSTIFLPYFISWIIVGSFIYNIFNFDTGTLNSIRVFFGMGKINVYQMPSVWKWIIMFFNSWKWVGYNSIIYIAAILGVDKGCHEAAEIDGANIFQRIWYITFPCIQPTIIVILLLNVGRILRGDFQMFYQIVGNNGQLFNATDVIDTYVFRSLINSGDIGMTTAATFYQSVICFVIIMTVNWIVKKINSDYALF